MGMAGNSTVERDLFTIGQAAQSVGVPATTLRYYEREGILTAAVRSRAGYRLYDSAALERLAFVRSAQAVGFTLDDIRTLLQLDGDDNRTCRSEVQRLLAQRLDDVETKMKELKRVRAALGRALDRCRASNGECPVIKELRPRRK